MAQDVWAATLKKDIEKIRPQWRRMAEDVVGVVGLDGVELVWPRRCRRAIRQRLWTATVNADEADRPDPKISA